MSGRNGAPNQCGAHEVAASGGEVDFVFTFDLHENSLFAGKNILLLL